MYDDNSRITILSVSWNSSLLLSRLVRNLREFASDPSSLRFIIADNTNGADAGIDRLTQMDCQIIPVDSSGSVMSMAHSIGLNRLMQNLDSPYTLIIDPDIALFLRQWDTILIDKLETGNFVAVGAPYPSWKLGKYHDFPSPPFALWNTDKLRELAPDWTPYNRTDTTT